VDPEPSPPPAANTGAPVWCTAKIDPYLWVLFQTLLAIGQALWGFDETHDKKGSEGSIQCGK